MKFSQEHLEESVCPRTISMFQPVLQFDLL